MKRVVICRLIDNHINFSFKIDYEDKDIASLSTHLEDIFKDHFKNHNRIDVFINGVSHIITNNDSHDIEHIKKLLKEEFYD